MSGHFTSAGRDSEPSRRQAGSTHSTPPAGFLTAAAIAVGGALGALSRVGLSEWWGAEAFSTSTLAVTLAINTVGAFTLGVLRRPQALKPTALLYSGLTVGFLGAFTTWSAVMIQLALLQGAGSWMLGAGYLLATLALGLSAAWWGLRSGITKSEAES